MEIEASDVMTSVETEVERVVLFAVVDGVVLIAIGVVEASELTVMEPLVVGSGLFVVSDFLVVAGFFLGRHGHARSKYLNLECLAERAGLKFPETRLEYSLHSFLPTAKLIHFALRLQ